LIKPFIKGETIKNITIVPDKILCGIPFEAVKDDKGIFLLTNYTIRYSYSAGLMHTVARVKQIHNKKYFAGFALDENNISLDYKSGDLLNAEKEVTTIANMVNGSAFTGNSATKINFLNNASGYEILHFSLHSEINHSLPFASRILFNTDQNTGDNQLSLGEILNLSINAELVVLSSCNSGLGKYVAGEGVMSLARGFAYAGCKSMVMSLWPVSDNTAFSVITGFYNNITNGETKDVALRSAKLSYLEKISDPLMQHPYYWAAMVPIGDMTPLLIMKGDIAGNQSTISLIYIGSGLIIFLVLIYLIKEKITRKQN
jgi:CHAT domain-containing protein